MNDVGRKYSQHEKWASRTAVWSLGEIDKVRNTNARQAPTEIPNGKSNAGADETPSGPSKRRSQQSGDEERCPSRNTPPNTRVGERGERGVETPPSLLPPGLPTREGLEQSLPDLPLDSSSGKDEAVCFCKRRSYKKPAPVRCAASVVKTVDSVHDSSAVPNIKSLWCFAESWRPNRRSISSPPLMDASNRPMRPLGLLVHSVWFGQFQVRIQFQVDASMAVDRILLTLNDSHVRVAIPPQRKARFHNSPSVAPLGAEQPPTEVLSDANHTKTGRVNDPPTSGKLWLIGTATALPVAQGTVFVLTLAAAVGFL